MSTHHVLDAAIIGGGLAGLTAAVTLARAGRSVALFETGELGGRAATARQDGFHLNWGPHALYRAGASVRILTELGVRFHGESLQSGFWALRGGSLHQLPSGLRSLVGTDLFGARVKLDMAAFLARLPLADAAALQSTPVSTWLRGELHTPEARELMLALLRVGTYSHFPDELSAGSALEQFRVGLQGVLYLDGGWDTLVHQLAGKAWDGGVEIRQHSRIRTVRPEEGGLSIQLEGGEVRRARSVIVTARPAVAARLLHGDGPAPAWAEQTPVRAACLDVALHRLPQPERNFGLGIDQPLYFSVHSAAAKLAPGDGAVIHVAKYLAAEHAEPAELERELEGVLDLMQPGWREETAVRRFLPNMVVTNALVRADRGGKEGRPDVDAADVPGVFFAGDWVGPDGMLADASLSSAVRAAEAAAAFLSERREREPALVG